MRNFKLISISFAAVLLFSCTDAPDSDKAKTMDAKTVETTGANESWKIDVAASSIEWVGTKVTGYHTGNVPLKSGEVLLDNGNVTGGKFIMDLANLTVSGPKGSDKGSNDKLLGHLKSADFFDVEKNPDATFELTDVKPFTGTVKDSTDSRQDEISEYKVTDPTHTVNGNLTIKGISKNIEFPARITVSGDNVEAKAKFNIDRKQWNIVYPGKPDDLIRDEIHLGISIKAKK
jgi:polyisoprenoid-binding protein YceI